MARHHAASTTDTRTSPRFPCCPLAFWLATRGGQGIWPQFPQALQDKSLFLPEAAGFVPRPPELLDCQTSRAWSEG